MGLDSILEGDWDFQFLTEHEIGNIRDLLYDEELPVDPPRDVHITLQIKYKGQIVFQIKNWLEPGNISDSLVWMHVVRGRMPLAALFEDANRKDQNFDDKNEI